MVPLADMVLNDIPVDGIQRILGRYQIAPRALVKARALLVRADTKFLLPIAVAREILDRVDEHYAVLPANGALLARYHTLYFDTPELRCFHDHRRGRQARHKVRIRHYLDRDVSFMELKTKRSERITGKKRLRKPFGDNELGDAERELVRTNSDLPAWDLRPRVWTNFRRITLIGLESNERVTMDLDLEVCAGDDRKQLAHFAIMEVKQYPYSARTPIMLASRALRQRPGSASKYCTAVALTNPGVRMNRLLPVLRAMEKLRR